MGIGNPNFKKSGWSRGLHYDAATEALRWAANNWGLRVGLGLGAPGYASTYQGKVLFCPSGTPIVGFSSEQTPMDIFPIRRGVERLDPLMK